MKKYIVKSEKGRVSRLFHEDRELGLLRYKNWYSMCADLEISYKKLATKSTGFWRSKMSILENDTELMSFGMDWKGVMINRHDKSYRLKATGVFSRKFILTETGSDEPLLTLKYSSKWRTMASDYEIESSAAFEALPMKDIFLLVTVSAVNYYITVIASAAA